jgi:hypothetical protein
MKSRLVQEKNYCSTPPRDLKAHENSGICMGFQNKNFTMSHKKLWEPLHSMMPLHTLVAWKFYS